MLIQHDIGAVIKVLAGVSEVAADEDTHLGPVIDRLEHGNPLSCVSFGLVAGAATGTPTSFATTFKLRHGSDPDGTTGWEDYGAAGSALDAAAESSETDYNLGSASRYIRQASVVDFTGGTTPTVPVVGVLVLGGFAELPA